MNPLVSIVVPIYNAEQYIMNCVHALQNQDYPHLEILLVDDGSRDQSPRICDMLAADDERIHVIHKENGGVSSARNAGIEKATGHYLMFCDSDDFYEKNMVSRMVALSEAWNVNYVICSYRMAKTYIEARRPMDNDKPFEPVWAMSTREFWNVLGYMITYRETMFAPWNKLFLLNVVKENHLSFPEDMSYGEDFIFNLQYLPYCNGVIETREKLYNYIVQNPESLENQYKPDLFENQTYLYKCAKEFMIANQVYCGYNIYNLSHYYARRVLHCIQIQGDKRNTRREAEKRAYVESFFQSQDVIDSIYTANLHETNEQRILTDLVKAHRYDEVYDIILSLQREYKVKISSVRYKVLPEEAIGFGWVKLFFKSVKKYGFLITTKRTIGKVRRKLRG